jgi:hypothetical protein
MCQPPCSSRFTTSAQSTLAVLCVRSCGKGTALNRLVLFCILPLLSVCRDVFDVIVQDKWPKDHFTVVGSMSNKFEMIEAGSNITHTFTVEPTFEGFYSADRAALSYRETREADPTVSYSNPMHNMSVLPNAVYQRLYAMPSVPPSPSPVSRCLSISVMN